MTNFSGENLNAGCGGPQGGGVDSRRNGVSEVSSKYLTEIASNPTPLGYKQTEVGMIPEDWEVKTVFELVDYQKSLFDDGDWIEAEHITSKGIRLIQTGNIGVGRYVEKDAKKYIFEESFEKLKCKELHEGDLLICRLAEPAGRACILPDIGEDKVITSVDVTIFRPSPELANREFYNQYFSSSDWFKSVLEQVGGTTHKRISRGALGRISVCYPNVEEQTAIANALSDVDALISELEKLIAKKQAIKTATMQQLLTGRTRLPQFALREDGTPKGTKPSELGEIPEDWEVHSLSSICDVRDGTHDSPKYKDNGIPLVTSKNIVDDILDLSNVSLISPEDAFEIDKRSKVDKGDIIMSMIGTVGSAVLLLEEPKFCIKNVALFKPKKVSGEFLVQLIRSKIFQDYLEDSMDGGIQKFVSLGTLRNMEISLPSEQEQTAIATILSDMDAEIQALEQRLGKTRQIKQGMMQELLTGKTRLIKPSKEVIHE